MLSLSIAVIFPEMKYSQTSNSSISSEFEYMVSKQRKGFLILGLSALVTFFTSIQTLSVGLFVFHLLLDIVFGVYAYASFQVRASLIQMQKISSVNEHILELDEYEYLKQAV
tara:strand:- start:42 stop:377 length:336 start_codon:yes stop_codon:yes gene_type:complete